MKDVDRFADSDRRRRVYLVELSLFVDSSRGAPTIVQFLDRGSGVSSSAV